MDNYSAVQFISDLQRLCESCSKCSKCALDSHYCIVYDRPRDIEEIAENIELVHQWAKDNPIENENIERSIFICGDKATEKDIELANQFLHECRERDNKEEKKVKTYAMDFFEKFPNAQKESDGTPKSCTQFVYGEKTPCCEYSLMKCKECWNRPMEGEG